MEDAAKKERCQKKSPITISLIFTQVDAKGSSEHIVLEWAQVSF